MPNFDELLRNNTTFARSGARDRGPAIPFIPNKQVYVLTCSGYDDAELAALAVLDPAATVPVDVEKIVSAPQVSPAIKVSGYSYDVKTGLVTIVVPPRSRQPG